MTERQKTISVIIPVFAANNSLKDYIIEISDTISKSKKINEMNYFLNKIILVDDGSPTNTHKVVKSLEENKVIQTIYLSKNYGQHAAIFAGVLSSTEDLIITMDEDGEHNPEAIEVMIERIEKENQAFAKRLFDKSGCISKKKFDEEYFAHTQYRNNLIKVP